MAKKKGRKGNYIIKRELIYKTDGQEYAQVLKMLGDGRVEAYCFDGVKRICIIRGKMKKRVWIKQNDIVLVGLRDYQDDKADIISKYTEEEARTLKRNGELPDNIKIGKDSGIEEEEEELPFEFTNDAEEVDLEDL